MATPRPAATPPCDSDPPCTETVESLWGMGTGPEDPDVIVGAEGSYDMDMATLMATVIAIGVILLLVHACFRLGLCCKHVACKGKPIQKKCCPCVEKKCCKRQALILKIALALILVGVVLSLLSYTAGSDRIGAAVEDVADAMKQLEVILGRLQQILGNMVNSVTDMTVGVNGIACDANAMLLAGKADPTPDIVADLTKTNTTIAKMKQSIYDMKSDVEKYRKRAEDPQVQDMINYAIALMVSLPFIIYIITIGLFFSCCRCKRPTSCCLNLGACWAGGPGLTMALVIFVALFVISITAADFCYLGPSKVLTQRAEGNEYAGYYLSGCIGENPLGEEVNNVAASVSNLTAVTTALDALPACGNINGIEICPDEPICSGVDEASQALEDARLVLDQAVLDLKRDVLNCSVFEPIIEHAFYDGVCEEAVEGLYSIWAVVVAAAVFTYMTLLVLPFATAAFAQDFFPADKPEKKLYGGTSGIRHEELKAHNAGASPLGRV